ncbi:MAG: hypothetical protein V2J65_08805 [Desulfobacteraceae bacterium]|jgi:hypothetical protein|nr:hypothetical protein [Desulfobacteraceae bacterium]
MADGLSLPDYTDAGLIGFAARFGGIPTNVGSGGGNQSVAILKSNIQVKDAVNRLKSANKSLTGIMLHNIQAGMQTVAYF